MIARTFRSATFGELRDTEENRLAAMAADRNGWPYSRMTGALLEEDIHHADGAITYSLRYMAARRYHKERHG